MGKDQDILADYIPLPAVIPIVDWLHKNKIQLKISRTRSTKLGDYRVDYSSNYQRISVNHNLNKYAFLITLVHEMAHAEVWKVKGNSRRILPHGKEWQNSFIRLMMPFLNNEVFPSELLPAVINYFKKPKASSVSDPKLMRALKKYDKAIDNQQLYDFSSGNTFVFRNTPFEVVKKLRTRYQCKNLQNGRLYLIHGMAEVEKLT
jgi:hypothetical protein